MGIAKLLVIDEASMMSKGFFEKLEFVARKIREREIPFGGLVVCLCGDFFQLPPISRGQTGDDALFCFESNMWKQCLASQDGDGAAGAKENCFALTQVFRQKDACLLHLLSEVRHNQVSAEGVRTLNQLMRALTIRNGVEATRLVPTNGVADDYNRGRLSSLQGGLGMEARFDAHDSAPPGLFRDEQLDQMTQFPRVLDLKVGAQVMLLKHISGTLVNGSRGVIDHFAEGIDGDLIPVVCFLSGEVCQVDRDTDTKDLIGGQRFSRYQVPLRLSWAITIHKSQGMTIDYLEVDLKNVFEAGQAYVALSRARTLEGLRVLSYDPRKFWTSSKVDEFYRTRVQLV